MTSLDDTKRDRILQRISKCFKLAESANSVGQANEAAVALRQARKMMDAYQITDADLAYANMGVYSFYKPHKTAYLWERYLLTTVTQVFGATYTYSEYGGKYNPRITVYGPEYRLKIIEHVYRIAHQMVCRATTAFVKEGHTASVAFKDLPVVRQEFRVGFVTALHNNIKNTFNPAETEQAEAYLKAYLEGKGIRTITAKESKKKVRSDLDHIKHHAYRQGQEEGAKASISIPLG